MGDPVRIMSLFSGVAGLDLGVRLAVPHSRVVCYLEREAYSVAVLAAKMAAGTLDEAPVWGDIGTFRPDAWAGKVDLCIGGFPCQPWSVAGAQRGMADSRWLWDDIFRVLCIVRPKLVFLENVRGLVSGGGLAPVLGDLAYLGFDAEWVTLSAGSCGAPHRRERVFILADRDERGQPERGRCGDDVADAAHDHRGSGERGAEAGTWEDGERGRGSTSRGLPLFPPGPGDAAGWRYVLERWPELAPAVEPSLRGVADGILNRVDRLRACGNGVVPNCAALAFAALAERLGCEVSGEGEVTP